MSFSIERCGEADYVPGLSSSRRFLRPAGEFEPPGFSAVERSGALLNESLRPSAHPKSHSAAPRSSLKELPMREIKLQDLKLKSPTELLAFAEENEVENASIMRKQELMFAILKQLSNAEVEIIGEGVVEVLQDGFGFLRSPDANYLPGPDDIYVSPSQIRRLSLRTGDTVEGVIRSPKEGERYFALLKVNSINFEDPEKARHKVNFDNLTPLYPDEWLKMEYEDPTKRISPPASSTSLRRLARVSAL